MSDGPGTVQAFVEIPRGSRNKYEYDEETATFHLDRVLYSSVHYPTDYGFIPGTLAPDGDHLDVLVLVEEPTFPGCMIEVRPLGGLDMSDEKGSDFKVLAVPVGDPRFDPYQALEDVGSLMASLDPYHLDLVLAVCGMPAVAAGQHAPGRAPQTFPSRTRARRWLSTQEFPTFEACRRPWS